MKRARTLFTAVVLAGAALLLVAAGPRLAPTATYHYDLTNCDGGVTATLPSGDYVLSFKDEGVNFCAGDAGCAAGGQWFPSNLTIRLSFGANGVDTPVSCRSDGMTGDVSINLFSPGT